MTEGGWIKITEKVWDARLTLMVTSGLGMDEHLDVIAARQTIDAFIEEMEAAGTVKRGARSDRGRIEDNATTDFSESVK
jgi:hypothetical protein